MLLSAAISPSLLCLISLILVRKCTTIRFAAEERVQRPNCIVLLFQLAHVILVCVIQFARMFRFCAAVKTEWAVPSLDFGCTSILHANRKEYKFVSALVSECEALPRAVAHAATDDQVDCNPACTIVW